MKKKKTKKFLKSALALVLVATLIPVNAFAAFDFNINGSDKNDGYYSVISKQDWDNAPGISESEIVLNNDAGNDRQVLHMMKADISNSYVNVIPTYSEMNTSKYQTGTMLDQANWIDQNMEGEVIGVMNCCLSWYSNYPAERVGEPLGFMMMNGEIMFDPGNCGYEYGNVGFPTCVVINNDTNAEGVARPSDIPKLQMTQIRTSADLKGWEDTVIPISSGYIVKDGVNQYNPSHGEEAPRSVVGITANGEVVIMENDGRQSPFSAGMNMYECAEAMISAGCVWAANCDGGGSSTFVSQRPGEELKVNNSPSDGGLRPSTSGICFISTAPADGQFAKADITTSSKYYTPNSEVQFKAVGTDLVGNTADIPETATWQLTDANMGTISDTGVFKSNGATGTVTAQLVYEGEVAGEASVNIVIPEISFKQETIVIGYNDSMNLPIDVTTNNGKNKVSYSSGDIVYTLSDDALGTIDGNKFTACDSSAGLTGGTITAVICGQEDKAVSASISFGKASDVVYNFEDGKLDVDTDPTVPPAEGESYGWYINDTRALGHMAYRFYGKKSYSPVGYDIPTNLYLVDSETGKVRNGNHAMGIDIDWTNVTASCHGQMDVIFPEEVDVTDATRVGFWMYVPAEMVTDSMQIRAGFKTTAGGTTAVTANITDHMGKNSGVENGGWYYFDWEVLDNYKSMLYFEINSHYTAGAGNYNYYQDLTFYVDDITVDYSDATIDRENPYFTSMKIVDEYSNGEEVSGQTINDNTITLLAQASENTTKTNATGLNRDSVKLYVDGELSKADIAVSAGGAISVDGLYLNDGVHTLVMEISDEQGNVGNIVRKLVVNTEKSAVRLEVPTPEKDLLPTGSIQWANIVADNLADIESVTTTVNLDYVNDWELEGMEVAYGFDAEYYINSHNDAVITFTRTSEDVADTNILAKLPIRIWMAKGWMDDSGIRKDYISNDPAKQDKYHILTPHAMWYSDGTRDYRMVVSAEAGTVKYSDGSTETFSANETVIQTEMNRYYTNANRQNKWSFHICKAGNAKNKEATCYETGYTGRVFCEGCDCGTVENLGTECDNHNGCGSVIEWGTTIPAKGHNYTVVDDKVSCSCGKDYVTTGLIEINGKYYYMVSGKLQSGWLQVKNNWHYFDTKTFSAVETYNNGYVTFEFEENGKLKEGKWYHTSKGSRYYYGPDYYAGNSVGDKRVTIDDKEYVFNKNGYCLKGYNFEKIPYDTNYVWYDFGEDGAIKGQWNYTGLYEVNGHLYCIKNGVSNYGMFEWEGAYYYNASANYKAAVKNIERECPITNGLMKAGTYRFGFDGKMVDKNIYNINGTLYYFEKGKVAYGEGKFVIEGKEYAITEEGKVLYTGIVKDASGQTLYYENGIQSVIVKNGLVKDSDGEIRYYLNDEAQYAGVVQDSEGNLYYINSAKKAVKNCIYTIGTARTNGLVEPGTYEFGADGRMIVNSEEPDTPTKPEEPDTPAKPDEPTEPEKKNGLVKDSDGEIRYYLNDEAQYAGVVQDSEGNLYYINSAKKAVKNCTYTIGANRTNGLINPGTYEFGVDGKMIVNPEEPDTPVKPDEPTEPEKKNGLVKDSDGEIRYYLNDEAQYAGVVQDSEGNLYYINSAKKAVKNCTYTIGSGRTNGLINPGTYEFGADGKLILK